MTKLLFLLGGLFCITLCKAQTNELYNNLDFSNCSSGFFWDEIEQGEFPPTDTDYVALTAEDAALYFIKAHFAAIDSSSNTIPSYSSICATRENIKTNMRLTPISILELKYNKLDEAAAQNGQLYIAGQQLYQTLGSNVFQSASTLIMHVDIKDYDDNAIHFVLNEDTYFQNYGSLPSQVRIDFDNGAGFQVVNFGQVVDVQYSDYSNDKTLRVDIDRDTQTHMGALILKHNDCTSNFPDPTYPVPWTTDNDANYPWQISINDQQIKGNAYLALSEDGVFDKPFIFVEGIDFETNTGKQRNGTFGWCQFTSGNSDAEYDYAILARMPLLLYPAIQHGYDIILLDFANGADYMESNGRLLVHLIEMVNETKIGNEPNVIAGASMGGQVSKYALDYMERNDIDHCTRLWISLDSPHEGANVPVPLQQAIWALKDQGVAATEFINGSLRKPGTKQLLNGQYVDALTTEAVFDPISNNEWYDLMHEWGYPTKCRTVGIANGNITGLGLAHDFPGHYEEDEPMLDYNCEKTATLLGPEARLFIMPTSGDPYYSDWWGYQSNSNSHATVSIALTEAAIEEWSLGDMISPWEGAPLLNATFSVKTKWFFYVPANQPNFDYAPGGIRNSMKLFVDAVNNSRKLQNGECNEITEYNKYHCFIPTASALGLTGLSPFENIKTYLQIHPEEIKFDRIFGPEGANEGHSMISVANLEIFKSEIFLGEDPDDYTPLLPFDFTSQSQNDGIFNYGIDGFNYIRSTHIHNGGQVYVNKNQILHYGLNGESSPQEGIFKITTWSGCAASDILVDNLGKLEIGDVDNTRRAELMLRPDSKLTIGELGTLRINPGSKIIIEKDAELIIHPNAIVSIDKGSIVVKAGGIVRVEGANGNINTAQIALMNAEANIIFETGGQLHIAANTTLLVNQGTASTSGYIEFKGADDHELFTGAGSIFKIIGDGTNDVMLKINNHADLWNANWGMGEIILDQCKVDMSDHGRIWTDMKFTATDVTFEATTDAGEIQVWSANTYINDCDFNEVRLHGMNSDANIFTSSFEGAGSGYNARDAAYYIYGSQFTACGVQSISLDAFSKVDYTAFRNFHEAILDDSQVELMVARCTFDGDAGSGMGDYGIFKNSGKLTLRCNQFEDYEIAIYVERGELNMRAGAGGGYNQFENVDYLIWFEELTELPDFYQGFNDFIGFNEKCMVGTVDIMCSNAGDCIHDTPIDGYDNYWGLD